MRAAVVKPIRLAIRAVRRFQAASPLVLSLSPGPKFETTLDPKTGATIALTGKIERKTGFTGEVNVTIAGQPRGIAVPKTVIKADQTDFSLELKIPANFAATEIKTIRVTASGPPNPKQKNIIVKVETPIEITIGRLSESSSP
ncbi:MAG: hypothetical protein IH991_19650 [Planctomycetes bacterium]|nr:hypothetical protein [Planctomycetota bacterium]